MRVLSILPFSPPSLSFGGAERQMHSLHKGLVKKGVEIHVLADISAVGNYYQEHEGISVWGVPFPVLTSSPWRPGNLKIWLDWRTIREIVHKRIPRPDLIQVTTFRQPALVGYQLASSLNVPYVVRLACSGSHGDLRFASNNWLSRCKLPKMVQSVSGVVALDAVTRQEAIDYGVPTEQIEIIPNALVLQKTPQSSIERRSIVFIGRLAQQKRIDSLLAAFSLFQEKNNEVPSLLIAGSGTEITKLEELACRLKITNKCEFLGAVPGPEDVLDRACCFINPSESEGLPNAVLEALAFGVPVILSDIPVHRQLAAAVGVEDYLFPVGDFQTLAIKLQSFLNLKDSEKQKLRHRCATYARQFTQEKRDKAYMDLYHRIVEERKRQCR